MPSPTEPPPSGPGPEPLLARMKRAVDETARLAGADLAPAAFYRGLLDRLSAALDATAAAYWTGAPGSWQLQQQINWSAVGLEQIGRARECHDALLDAIAQTGQPRIVPPQSVGDLREGEPAPPANLSPYTALLAPVHLDRRTIGILEVWQDARRAIEPAGLPFLVRMAEFVAAYEQQQLVRRLEVAQQLWTELEAFARQVHTSLDLREVAYTVANDGRRLIGADRLSVAVRRGDRAAIEAVSGADTVERRSRPIRALAVLCDRVLAWGETLRFRGIPDERLPAGVRAALDNYLLESSARVLLVVPLRDPREAGSVRPPRSALVVEWFEQAVTLEQAIERVEIIARHIAPALYNAVEYRRVPLRWLWRPMTFVRDSLESHRGRRGAVWVTAGLLLVAALTLMPWQYRLEAKGQVLPKNRDTAYAPFHGRVVQVRAAHGERVIRGQELLILEDLEGQQRVQELATRISSTQGRLAEVKGRLNKSLADEERATLSREQVNLEHELRRAVAEQALVLERVRDPRRAVVTAPRPGVVVTFDPREELVGKTVKPGDPLVRVARVDGPWEVELFLPEAHVGPVREALAQSGGKPLTVDLLVASHPNRTYRGRLFPHGLGGETTVIENEVVLPVRVELADADLIERLGGLPVGVEVRAKVHCGKRAVGYVWFHQLWEFFYEHVVF